MLSLFLQKNTFFAISRHFSPLTRIILIAPVPSGVEIHAIVLLIMVILYQKIGQLAIKNKKTQNYLVFLFVVINLVAFRLFRGLQYLAEVPLILVRHNKFSFCIHEVRRRGFFYQQCGKKY